MSKQEEGPGQCVNQEGDWRDKSFLSLSALKQQQNDKRDLEQKQRLDF